MRLKQPGFPIVVGLTVEEHADLYSEITHLAYKKLGVHCGRVHNRLVVPSQIVRVPTLIYVVARVVMTLRWFAYAFGLAKYEVCGEVEDEVKEFLAVDQGQAEYQEENPPQLAPGYTERQPTAEDTIVEIDSPIIDIQDFIAKMGDRNTGGKVYIAFGGDLFLFCGTHLDQSGMCCVVVKKVVQYQWPSE